MPPMKSFVMQYGMYISWLQAIIATGSSLYLSEVLQWTPCILCWYQRILMYPLVIIILVGIYIKDKLLPYYVLALSIPGALMALYHYLLQKGVLPQEIAPCTLGASCEREYIGWFGFITIPLLSFAAFAVISIVTFLYFKYSQDNNLD